MRFLPCDPWVEESEVADDPRICPEGSGEPLLDVTAYITRATEAMWVLTGRRFGVCSASVRPVRNRRPYPGSWHCTDDGIALHSPLVSVDEVRLDGALFTDYQIRNGRTIHRTDGEAWPEHQDLAKPVTEDGTLEITYTYGTPPPMMVSRATRELAVQYVLLDRESELCQLPMGAKRVTYQGLTIDMERALESSNRLISDAVNSYPMGAGAPSDLWFADDWELVLVSA